MICGWPHAPYSPNRRVRFCRSPVCETRWSLRGSERRSVADKPPRDGRAHVLPRRRRRIPLTFDVLPLVLFAGLAFSCWKLIPARAPQLEAAAPVGDPFSPRIVTIYPLSLIPGGLQSDDTLETARASDPVLAKHYADVGFLRPAWLLRDQWFYASYRRGGAIFWTGSQVRVRAGEEVFADRSGNMIRGRCGNRLSEAPHNPVEFVLPPELAIETQEVSFAETPQLPKTPLNDLVSFSFPPFPPVEPFKSRPDAPRIPTSVGDDDGPWAGPATLDPFPPFPPNFSPVRKPSLITPEPNTFNLVVAGGIAAAALAVCSKRFQRYKIHPKPPPGFTSLEPGNRLT